MIVPVQALYISRFQDLCQYNSKHSTQRTEMLFDPKPPMVQVYKRYIFKRYKTRNELLDKDANIYFNI